MLQSCVFRSNVNTRQWIHAAVRRAVKTMAQTFIATIGTAAFMGDVNWPLDAVPNQDNEGIESTK